MKISVKVKKVETTDKFIIVYLLIMGIFTQKISFGGPIIKDILTFYQDKVTPWDKWRTDISLISSAPTAATQIAKMQMDVTQNVKALSE